MPNLLGVLIKSDCSGSNREQFALANPVDALQILKSIRHGGVSIRPPVLKTIHTESAVNLVYRMAIGVGKARYCSASFSITTRTSP